MDMREINAGVIEEFRANAGVLSGPLAGAPVLLLTTTGHRTGRPHTTPIGFIDDGTSVVVAAANGGSDHDPDWLRNVRADGRVTVELAGTTRSGTAVTATGADRQTLLARLSDSLPGMADHISATSREIPVVVISERSD